MNVAVIGSGGREHSICYKLINSNKIKNLYCIPGNAGTEEICKNINIDILNFELLYKELSKNDISIVIVGPEIPLVQGIVDFLSQKNIFVLGPNKKASQLEGSKAFMKKFCKDFGIPTASYNEFSNFSEAENYIKSNKLPIVIKADGLAAGKGVSICETYEDAVRKAKEILEGKFKSSKKVVIEEFLEGEEASYFVIVDKNNFLPIGTAQDHKRIGENETGPNTGGMGAYSPSFLISKEMEKKIIEKIIDPTINGLKKIGCPYTGILYAGLMIKNNEPKLIEYNIRFGDPECQVLMMRLENDLLDLIIAAKENKLNTMSIKWKKESCITIVAASKGYPNKYKKNTEIRNLEEVKNDTNSQMFHAGTIKKDNRIFAIGGRVLNSTSMGSSLLEARKKSIEMLNLIGWEEIYFRKDIGWRIVDKK